VREDLEGARAVAHAGQVGMHRHSHHARAGEGCELGLLRRGGEGRGEGDLSRAGGGSELGLLRRGGGG